MSLDIKKIVKKFLIEQDSNTARLAAKLGCGTSTIYDKYRRNTFSVADLEKIAAAYGYELKIEFVKPKNY